MLEEMMVSTDKVWYCCTVVLMATISVLLCGTVVLLYLWLLSPFSCVVLLYCSHFTNYCNGEQPTGGLD